MIHAMSLNEAKELVIKNNSEMKTEEQNLKMAQWDLKNARFDMLPTAKLQGNYNLYQPEINMGAPNSQAKNLQSFGLAVNFPLFVGGKLYLGQKMKSDALKMSEISFKTKKLEILSTLENKFFKVLETKELMSIAEMDYQSAQANEEIAKIRYENGSLSSADYLNFRTASANKKLRLLQSQNAYLLSKNDLINYLSIPSDTDFEAITEDMYIEWISTLQNTDLNHLDKITQQISEYTSEHNTAIQISKLSVKTAENAHLMNLGNFLPTVNLSYTQGWQKYDFQDKFGDLGTLVLSASIPIFPVIDDYSATEKSRSAVRKATYQMDTTEKSIRLAVQSSLLSLITSIQSYESAKLSLEYAEEFWQQKNVRFKNNLLSANEMLDADVIVNNARTQHISSIYNILRAKSALMQVINSDSDETLKTLLKN
jgi:outer membrane protein TolC